MKTFRLTSVLVALACLLPSLFAADKASEKNPGDAAYDAFVKLIDEKDAKQDQSRINALSQAGIEFLLAHPTHKNANSVIDRMLRLKDQFKSKPALKGIFYTHVQGALLGPLFDDSLSADAKAAVRALDTAMSEGLFRMNANKMTLAAWQEKLEAQLKHSSSRELLKARAVSLYEVLLKMSPGGAEKLLNDFSENEDKTLSSWAKAELKFAQVRKAPFELEFTALDGSPVNVTSSRGKVVCLFFWSVNTPNLKAVVDKLKENTALYGAKQLLIVAVNADAEADREKVVAAVKEQRFKWPVYFDGKGANSDLFKKLNVTAKTLPATLLIDQKGTLAPLPAGKLSYDDKTLEGGIKDLLAAKK
jgi:cytochrome oxidase Cu insertion factor (SCO1/SenC/PrrC family)